MKFQFIRKNSYISEKCKVSNSFNECTKCNLNNHR